MTQLAPVKPGDLLGGRFRVERVLGEGGMGLVVAAWHEVLHARVALKLLRQETPSAAALERFLREARAAASLRGENVARVLDVGTLPDGTPFLVMELLEGETLSDVLARGPMPITEAVDVAIDVCAAMAEAHRAGIIHRDLKPANLVRTERPDGTWLVKVLDFGIAKTLAPDLGTLTSAETILGSPRYMSPEQARDPRDVDGRTDIWSLGVLLYELLTGRAPFEAYTAAGVLFAIASSEPAPPRSMRAELDPELETILVRCLAKDRQQRVQTMAELALSLARFGGAAAGQKAEAAARTGEPGRRSIPRVAETSALATDQTVASESRPVDTTEATAAPWATKNAGTTGAREPARNRSLWIGMSLLGVLAVGGASAALLLRAPTPSQTASPANSPNVAASSATAEETASAARSASPSTSASAAPLAANDGDSPPPMASASDRRTPAPKVATSARGGAATPPSGKKSFGSEDWGDRK